MKKLTDLYRDLPKRKTVNEAPIERPSYADDSPEYTDEKASMQDIMATIDDQIEELSKLMLHDPELRSKFMQARQHFAKAFEIIEDAYV